MSETKETVTNPIAVLPDISEKPISVVVVEQYLVEADAALKKIKESLDTLKSHLTHREKELIVVNGQKDLLLALQKTLLEKDQTKK